MPSETTDENLTILLISSSKLLKNKFIEAVSNDLNHFSLMNKSISVESERLNFSCFICDYSVDQGKSTSYIQLIDINGKLFKNVFLKKHLSWKLKNFQKKFSR